jgi:predicted DsbA family dithiol-disulfide isomerase
MITLYSTGCPNCLILKKKLGQAGIEYMEETNIELMREKGFDYLPKLEVEGEVLSFAQAVSWVNEQIL